MVHMHTILFFPNGIRNRINPPQKKKTFEYLIMKKIKISAGPILSECTIELKLFVRALFPCVFFSQFSVFHFSVLSTVFFFSLSFCPFQRKADVTGAPVSQVLLIVDQ